MPRYKLRTLLILLAVGPPFLAGVWFIIRLLSEALSPVDVAIHVNLLTVTLTFSALWFWRLRKIVHPKKDNWPSRKLYRGSRRGIAVWLNQG